MAAAPGAQPDRVVRTIDVYLAQDMGPGGLVYLLQSPLRPPDRPYDVEFSEDVRFKARANLGFAPELQ